MADVTRILNAIEQGDLEAADELLPIVYGELRRLAAHKLSHEKPGQTLQPTALVHEAYIRLVASGDPGWQSRRHFFGAAAEAMRRILVERARRKMRLRHGGAMTRVDMADVQAMVDGPLEDMLALDEALAKLTGEDKLKADLVKLHCFTGLTLPETAEMLDISLATAERHWAYARAWLRAEMVGHQKHAPGQ